MTDFTNAMMISASGMRAQSARIRVIAENLANANSTGATPGEDPYRRQVPVFGNYLDKELGAELVEVKRVSPDMSEFGMRFDPNHPASNAEGYVQLPNVNSLVEMMDMREAQRSYEANLSALDSTRSMVSRTLELLR
ncbi:MAG: flagellar basal body rod protein FlgC [Pseudomonadota bacterium]